MYRVRRVLRPRKTDPTRMGNAVRSITIMDSGTRAQMAARLSALADEHGAPVETEDADHPRVWLHRRGEGFPAFEEFLVAAPARAHDKTGRGFTSAWNACAQSRLW